MYRTNHLLRLLALPALLLLAACADDVTPPAAEAPGTLAGQPVRFTATGLTVTPVGVAQTKADGTETDFPANGSTMTVYMTGNDEKQQADYTYTNGTWEPVDKEEALLWPDTKNEYTFTAISPAGTDPEISLPAAWTADNIAAEEYNDLRTTYGEHKTKAKSSLSLTLRHALVKVQVVSISDQPVYLTDAPTAGKLDLQGGCDDGITKETVTLYSAADGMTYEGYVLPSESGFGFLADNVYTVNTELTAGTVVTTCDMEGSTAIVCPEPGKLKDVWPENATGTVVITGTLDNNDLNTIGDDDHKNDIAELYVMGEIEHPEHWGSLSMSGATQLVSVYLAEATKIGNGAFLGCKELESVTLPQAKSIGNNAFQTCNALTSVNLPQATSIGSTAFQGCSSMASISLPKATSIGSHAFEHCTKLASICLPKDASIEANAFNGCNDLTTLFLSDKNATLEDAKAKSDLGGIKWETIYYGYKGTDGDYLNTANYEGPWTNNN